MQLIKQFVSLTSACRYLDMTHGPLYSGPGPASVRERWRERPGGPISSIKEGRGGWQSWGEGLTLHLRFDFTGKLPALY